MSKVTEALDFQEKHHEKGCKMIKTMTDFYLSGNTNMFNAALYEYITHMENSAIDARNLPALAAMPTHKEFLTEALAEAHEIEINITTENWINIKMPCLLPGKMLKAKKEFSFSPLFHTLENFKLERKNLPFYPESVIAIRHIYSRDKPLGLVRDNDNVDTKIVVDVIKTFFLPDDNGLICSHFYDSKLGRENMTDIYIFPRHDFENWWEKHC